MKVGPWILAVFAAGLPYAMAGELAGTWEGRFTRGTGTFSAGFDLDVTGDRITGAAFVEGWGYSSVFDGRIEGDRFRFTVDRKTTGDGPVTKVEFDGSVAGKVMTLAMMDGTRLETTLHRVESQVTDPVSVDAAPEELEGKWKARFVGLSEDDRAYRLRF